MATTNKTLTPEELTKIKSDILKSMTVDRFRLLQQMPFIGSILLKLNMIPVRDVRCDTACTDGHNIYFDCDFYMSLTPEERMFVIAHEGWHVILLHFARRQTRLPDVFNIATDMEVNRLLKANGLTLAKGALLPPPNKGLDEANAETIYAYLLKKKSNNKDAQSQSGSGSSDGQSQSSSNTQSNNNMSASDFGGKSYDKHVYDKDGQPAKPAEGSQMPSDRWGEKGLDSDFGDMKISSGLKEEIRSAVIEAQQNTLRMKGKMPVGLDQYIKELVKPEVNWKEVLAQFVTQCYGGERKWGPFNRRMIPYSIYLPAMRSDKIKVGVLLDTSGSCTYDIPKFLSEIYGLVKSFGKYELTIINCDSDVHKSDTFLDDDEFDPLNYKVTGGGGSDFRPAFTYIRKKAFEFDCLVGFTDGYIDVPTNKPPFPVLWLITEDGDEKFCKWGQITKFKRPHKAA